MNLIEFIDSVIKDPQENRKVVLGFDGRVHSILKCVHNEHIKPMLTEQEKMKSMLFLLIAFLFVTNLFSSQYGSVFGYVYDDEEFAKTLHLCDQTSPYALTGAIFSTDRQAVVLAERTLRHAAGNFYINDKPTGAVVGQQPFGGGRASGTNDKAGGIQNMLRWTSPRSITETFVPPRNYPYPFMG